MILLSPPAAAADATRVCLLMCVPRPVPIHCTRARTAGDGCSWETADGRLPSCLTLITRRGNKQTMNVLACKFSETRLTVKRQRYRIVDYFGQLSINRKSFYILSINGAVVVLLYWHFLLRFYVSQLYI